MKDEFKTVDITRLTPEERVLAMVNEPARPGKLCENSPGFIHEGELEQIANHLEITIPQLKENLLREVPMYGKTLHKPKHQTNVKRIGHEIIGTQYEMPYGPCVFLDSDSGEHKCGIENAKPLHCRLATKTGSEKLHAWYLLQHAIDTDSAKGIRQWAIHLETHPTIPGGELHELVPDREKRGKILNFIIR